MQLFSVSNKYVGHFYSNITLISSCTQNTSSLQHTLYSIVENFFSHKTHAIKLFSLRLRGLSNLACTSVCCLLFVFLFLQLLSLFLFCVWGNIRFLTNITHIATKSIVTLVLLTYTYLMFNMLQDLVYAGNIS